MMRLDKMLADAGYGTRSEVRKMIRQGIVAVNGETVRKQDAKVDEEKDLVTFDGEEVLYSRYVYFMLNKPAGYISATNGNVPVVLDLVPEPYRDLFPCGRLDKDTEGLLLITNDGPLTHALLSPKKHVEKEYYVRCAKQVSDDDIRRLEEGIMIDGGEVCRPARVYPESENECRLVITEGKYHEIKRMFEALDNEVIYLKRLRMKNLVLDETLAPGEYRPLTDEEITDLRGV